MKAMAPRSQSQVSTPTKPGFYWVKLGCWQPCEVRDLGANGLWVWFLGVPKGYTMGEVRLEWGPGITKGETA